MSLLQSRRCYAAAALAAAWTVAGATTPSPVGIPAGVASGAFSPIVIALAQPSSSGAGAVPWTALASMKGVRWSSPPAKAFERGLIKGTLKTQPESTWLGWDIEIEVKGDRSSIQRVILRSYLPHQRADRPQPAASAKTSDDYKVDLGVFAPGQARAVRTTCDDESPISPVFHVVVNQSGRKPLHVGFAGAQGNSAMALEWTISFSEREMLAASGPDCARE